MKYRIIGDNNYFSDNIQTEIFKNRGINDIKKFLEIDDSVLTPPNKFKNMDKAVECMLKHMDNNSNIYILEDADPDGLTSAALIYNYLKETVSNININYIVHNKRVHGIILEEMKDVIEDIDLLIVPDAGSENLNAHKMLKNFGIDCIVLDHHDTKKRSNDAIVVNNQQSKISTNLSGVGMAHKFCKALDDELWEDNADNYLDLVALGLISDMMDISDLEVQWYIQNGLKKIKNKAFKEMIKTQEYSIGGNLNPNAISFYITPMINSIFRLGGREEYKLLFRSFIGNESESFTYCPTRGKNKGIEREENIYEHTARISKSFNDKRKRLSKKMIKEFTPKIKTNNKIITINIGGEYGEKGMARLVVNGLNRKYGKPIIAYYKSKDNKIKGSMASHTNDFKNRLNKTGLFEFVSGHQKAAGLEIKKDSIENLDSSLNEVFKDEIFEKVYPVDFNIPSDDFLEIGEYLIQDIFQLKDVYGKGLDEPLIRIENISLNNNELELIGAKKNTLKFKMNNDVSFIKFNSNEEYFNSLVDEWGGDLLTLNIIGRCSIDEYNGGYYPQIVIEEIEKVG